VADLYVAPEEAQRRINEALAIASDYGQTDGDHHKTWCIDQIVRALTGCPEVKKEALDYRGKPYTFTAYGESEEYRDFIAEHCDGEDGPETYSWDEGIAL